MSRYLICDKYRHARYRNMTDSSETSAVLPRPPEKEIPEKAASATPIKALSGSQTLVRGLDVLEAVAAGATTLASLCEVLDLNRSTMHRLATTLVGQRYLSFAPRVGYALGPKLLELGFQARAQM